MLRSSRKAQPPQRGQIRVSALKIAHAKWHLAGMTASAAEVAELRRALGHRRGLARADHRGMG
jgi:hypothetical protein